MNLPQLRRRLIDRAPVTITDRDPVTDGLRSYILFDSETEEIISALERAEHAERVRAALVELVRRASDPGITADDMGAGIMLAEALKDAEAVLEGKERR